MRVKKLNSESERFNIEQKVLSEIRNGDATGETLNSFFINARKYAQNFLVKSYLNIEKFEWDIIFANVNLKFVKRIKNGVEIKPGTRLSTYYTSIAKFAVLDFVRDRQGQQFYQKVEEHQAVELPFVERKMEREERAQEIRSWLFRIIGHEDQVKVLLLQAEGFAYKDIVIQTGYQSEGACRNASVKGKKKIANYLIKHPEAAKELRKLLQGS